MGVIPSQASECDQGGHERHRPGASTGRSLRASGRWLARAKKSHPSGPAHGPDRSSDRCRIQEARNGHLPGEERSCGCLHRTAKRQLKRHSCPALSLDRQPSRNRLPT
jgi:hypothetical protein